MPQTRSHIFATFLGTLLLAPITATAAEVLVDGYYRAESEAFNSLSLNSELADAEGGAFLTRHRLLLRPRFLINDSVSAFVDLRALDSVGWGTRSLSLVDPVTGEELPIEFSDSLEAPYPDSESTAAMGDINIWHAWGEVYTTLGRFKFGRMPLHIGSGIWLNDGMDISSDYGDTADRIQWSKSFDKIFVSLAYDINSDQIVNEADATTSYTGGVGYRSETTEAGIHTRVRRTPSRNFSLFTIDGSLNAEMGLLTGRTEVVAQFGSGDLENGANDVSISGVGAVLALDLNTKPLSVGIEGGVATGDADESDQLYKRFTFDRDYNIALMMFEHPMPTLTSAVANASNLGRSTDYALTGDAISNALYMRPHVGYEVIKDNIVDIAGIFARTAKLPEFSTVGPGYGMEFDLTWTNTAIENFTASSSVGLFLPGAYYSDFDDDTYSGFESPAFAGRLFGAIKF